jgi:hypothetical protein
VKPEEPAATAPTTGFNFFSSDKKEEADKETATEPVTQKKKKRKRSKCICSKKKKVAYCNKYEKLKRKHRKQKKQSFKQPFMKEKPMFNAQPHPSEVSPFDQMKQ